jgi:hypothetical protein
MGTHTLSANKFFWMAMIIILLISGGQISASTMDQNFSNIVISEIMAANGTGLVDEDGDHSDWIEIHNRGAWPVNLGGWALTNDPAQPRQWKFPEITLDARAYLVIFTSGKNRTEGKTLHTNFKLARNGEYLGVYSTLENRFMDEFKPYPRQFRDISYGRYDLGQDFGYMANPSPGLPNEETLVWSGVVAPVTFSAERGFYTDAFTVALSTATPKAAIRYTLDGSEPTDSHGTLYTQPIPIDHTITLRAVAYKPELLPAKTETHTYLFTKEVVRQFARPQQNSVDWNRDIFDATTPAPTRVNIIDALKTVYNQDELITSLKSLPSLSLVTTDQYLGDLHNLPANLGKNVERPASIEFISSTDRNFGFQINVGVRPYEDSTAEKQSFQLFFRSEYGATGLEYPLFDDSPIVSFDSVILQAETGGQDPSAADSYIHNEWIQDSQSAMIGMASHGRFVHLYLNGQYWGVYNLRERINPAFVASYLGGEKKDWFIANSDGPQNENTSAQADMPNYIFSTIAISNRFNSSDLVQPQFLSGIYQSAAGFIDPNQMADFTILQLYNQALNWPGRNWTTAIRLMDLPGRGRLFMGDESSPPPTISSSGPASRFDAADLILAEFLKNPDFKVTLTDRLYKHFSGEGALTDAAAQSRWQALAQNITPALAVEAIRWPDIAADGAKSAAASSLLGPGNGLAGTVLKQARRLGYYPPIDPPLFSQPGGIVATGAQIALSQPAGITDQDCAIYVTTDTADPRLPVTGEIMPSAVVYQTPLTIDKTTTVKARMRCTGKTPESAITWSALQEAVYTVVKQDSKLRLTEIMYNPIDGDNFEFVELQNVGDADLSLANISLDDGLRFTYPPNAPTLAPGQFAVLVSNAAGFAQRYPGVEISGVYEGHLSNKGERIVLLDANFEEIMSVTYDDENGWPISPDGRGDSLVLINPNADPINPHSWRASSTLYGSPGRSE